jgi:KTSC domain
MARSHRPRNGTGEDGGCRAGAPSGFERHRQAPMAYPSELTHTILSARYPLMTARNASAISLAVALACCTGVETIDVKGYGSVSLQTFSCDHTRSSIITRICYDQSKQFMILKLNETYYPHCAVDSGTVSELRQAGSLHRFYNENIKRRFACRATSPQ